MGTCEKCRERGEDVRSYDFYVTLYYPERRILASTWHFHATCAPPGLTLSS